MQRKFPYTFKSVYRNYVLTINGVRVKFHDHIFETEDEELAKALRKKAKEGNYFKELPVVELYRRAKQEEKKEEKTVEEVVKEMTEKKKKMFYCPECGAEFPSTAELDKHKTMKHPEKYLMPDVNRWKIKRDKLLKSQTFSKKNKKNVDNDVKK